MAVFFLQITSVQRSAGRRATASAAYRAGERIRDERSGEVHNHTRRRDILHAEIFLPAQFDGQPVGWARQRERLWNSAEHAEKRHNARVAREYQVTLPAELSAAQRVTLARDFAREISERYKVAVDLAVHEPRPGGDARHFHAHLLTTTREITPTGLGAKAGLDMHAVERRRRGLPDHSREFVNVRERWATLANEALRAANLSERIDHRSLAAQGIDREPLPRIPLSHLKMEQRGLRSEVAERLRAAYRERVQRRLERSAGAAATTPAPAREPELAPPAAANVDIDEVRRQAREAWLALRSQQLAGGTPPREAAPTAPRNTRERDAPSEAQPPEDLAL